MPIDAPPPPAHTVSDYPISFTGKGDDYAKIWAVNLLLTVLTLGIYSAWAKVRRERYFLGNTWLAGANFDYHAKPLQILRGRLIAVALLIGYSALQSLGALYMLIASALLLLAMPWLMRRALIFRCHMISYRGLRFHFGGDYKTAFVVFAGYGVLTLMTFGLTFPLQYRAIRLYLFNNLGYGSSRFSAKADIGAVYVPFLIVGLIYLLLYGMLSIVVIVGVLTIGHYLNSETITFQAFLGQHSTLFVAGFVVLFLLFTLIQKLIGAGLFTVALGNLFYNGLRLTAAGGEGEAENAQPIRFISRLQLLPYLSLTLQNGLLTFITLGIYSPWAAVRTYTHRAARLLVRAFSLDEFVANVHQANSATGDEAAQFFNIDIAL